MAAPNIVSVTTIKGNTAVANVTTISSNIVVNAASSNTVQKINALYISNVTSANSGNVSIAILRGGVEYFIARTISVPTTSSLDVITKAIYLQEGDALRVSSGANNVVQAVVSYEEIS